MIFRMDTDAVRAMAAKFRSTANTMETSLTAINQGVKGAPWQSQAREEFITLLETLQGGTLRSAEVLRMMAGAAEEKASQWEAIGNIFNGPFQALSGLWNRLKDNMGWLWGRIKGAITGVRLPSVPHVVLPVITFGGIIGWFDRIVPDWSWKKLTWWPHNNKTINGDTPAVKGEKIENETNQNAELLKLENQRDRLRKQLEIERVVYNAATNTINRECDKLNEIYMVDDILSELGWNKEELMKLDIVDKVIYLIRNAPDLKDLGLGYIKMTFNWFKINKSLKIIEACYEGNQSRSSSISHLSEEIIRIEQQIEEISN